MPPGQVRELFMRQLAWSLEDVQVDVGNTAGKTMYGEHGVKGKVVMGADLVSFRNHQGLFCPKQALQERLPPKEKGPFSRQREETIE